MNFSCPACQAKYFVRDEDVVGRTLKLACRKCRGVIPIQGRRPGMDGPVSGPRRAISSDRLRLSLSQDLLRTGTSFAETPAPPSLRPSLPPRLPDDDFGVDFYVGIGGAPVGPLNAVQLAERAEQGDIGPRTYVWRPGQAAWKRLADVPELSVLFAVLSTPPPMVQESPSSAGAASTLEERLGFGYLGEDPPPRRSTSTTTTQASTQHVRQSPGARAPEPESPWTSMMVSLVISVALGVALGALI